MPRDKQLEKSCLVYQITLPEGNGDELILKTIKTGNRHCEAPGAVAICQYHQEIPAVTSFLRNDAPDLPY